MLPYKELTGRQKAAERQLEVAKDSLGELQRNILSKRELSNIKDYLSEISDINVDYYKALGRLVDFGLKLHEEDLPRYSRDLSNLIEKVDTQIGYLDRRAQDIEVCLIGMLNGIPRDQAFAVGSPR